MALFSFDNPVTSFENTYYHTVWKFHNFSPTQILREIDFRNSRSAKSAILTNLEALNFEFYAIFAHF